MTDSYASTGLLANALQQLHAHGTISLTGRPTGPNERWRKRQKTILLVFSIISMIGTVTMITGIIVRGTVGYLLLVPLGGFVMFVGGVSSFAIALVGGAQRSRVRADLQPVVLDAWGIRLRGFGPIPWGDVGPPEYRRIMTKNEPGGMCAVMPLTPVGHARVNALPVSIRVLVGPKPYLRLDVPYLLLPGIEGYTEADVIQLFGTARDMFNRRP
ncbi:hypothetical protein [Microbacterium sp. MPKO10]|uniref:hypothetical protein n=1 Tax=Microbacterium sp. MPKO10 TaxID=2989818 RepID=UPI0022355E2D|nr:hypothetical protein [Microbacterium sp. MPKO10]MCW4459752.1 hypothetical protein [Microbacterium sp. MPKO10]